MYENEIKKIALRRMLLKIIADDFDLAVVGIINNLSDFKNSQEQKIIQSLVGSGGDFASMDMSQKEDFINLIHLEKTVGNSAAKAAIIVVSSFIKSAAKISDLSADGLFSCAPKIVTDLSWAESVEVASNYIRHLDEWQIPSKTPIERGEDFIWKNVKNLVGQLPTPRARRNADFIKKVGFKSEDIIGISTDISYQLALKIGLDNFDQTSARFREWTTLLA